MVERHRLAVTPDDVATVIYTSGTTGRPKGCVLTHANFMAETDNVVARWEPVFANRPGEEPSTLLFLPLAHVFGRMVEVACVRSRIRLGHQPSMAAADLLPDLVTFRPTFVLAVPYVFEKVFQAARRKAEASGKLGPFDKAVDVAVRHAEAMEAQGVRHRARARAPALRMQHQLYDKLVYSKVRAALGGRVRHGISGGSAMERRLGLFFCGAGVTIYEGYGLTETTRGGDREPAGADQVRHRGPAGARHHRADRRRRRDLAQRRPDLQRLPQRPQGHRPRCCATAGWPPATSARSTRTAI